MSVKSSERGAVSHRAPRILVVEDESIIALDIRTKLGMLGYDPVGIAGTGEEAIAKAEALSPDLILMDVRLRGEMDGIAAAGRIQEQLHIPVVYITAFGDDETMARAKETNPFGYLIKPFQEKDLRTTVDMALYRYRMEQALREAHHQLELHGMRQAAIASLGLKALAGIDMSGMFQEAASIVSNNLGVDGTAVLELSPDREGFIVKAAVGWVSGYVGQPISIGPESMSGYALASGAPVTTVDLARETRFEPWTVALEHGITSALTVLIQGRRQPHGVLAISSRQERVFTQDEVHFAQAVANVLAMTIDRKRDDEQLRQQATILANVRDAIIVTDQEGRIVYWNSGAGAIFGYSAQEMLGRSVTSLYPQGAEEERQRQWQQIAMLDEGVAEQTQVRKDGQAITVDLRAAKMLDSNGKPLGTIAAARDVTAQRQMEETIRQLSTPMLQVREGMLLVPLIGMIDPGRAHQLMDQALRAIRARRARVLVVDLTGVAAVDTAVAQHLAQTASAARMLGATVIFTGISASIAGTLVELGERLKGIHIAGDLQRGIEDANRFLSPRLDKTGPPAHPKAPEGPQQAATRPDRKPRNP